MLALDLLAERKIAEALARGELQNLPGEGCPLDLTDDPMVPEELRIAYRILKNAGYIPPEVESLNELRDLERMLDDVPEGEARRQALLRLDLLRARLDARKAYHSGAALRDYRETLVNRLARR